jgi:hypothetical protein
MYVYIYIRTRRGAERDIREKRRMEKKEQRGVRERLETGWAKKCNNNPLTGSNAFSTGKLLFYFA